MNRAAKKSAAKKTGSRTLSPAIRPVLAMTGKQARAFFLKPESYCRVDLPSYFDFGRVLRPVTAFIGKKTLSSASSKPRDHEGVNYRLYSNKDGRYAWRPFQLIHPAVYVELTRQMTEAAAWKHIQARFAEFSKNQSIRCFSIPRSSSTKRKDQAAQVLNWWQEIEQASIELALDYSYVYHADITDCYGSIYTHSIAWALHTKAIAKAKKSDMSLIGNVIDSRMQDMQQGQTNGIPQGSVLVDLIAEMVLGHADLELSGRLATLKITEFKLLRYRDDYRIFANSPEVGARILKALTEVLLELGLKLNASKTSLALAVISSSIKEDKKQWMRSRQTDSNLQKHLLLIHCHSHDFPNAGSLLSALDGFYQRLTKTKSVRNALQLVSIATDIGFHNPRCFPVCAAIISQLLSRVDTKKQKLAALARVRDKLAQLPNNGHLEVWQQRLSYHFDPKVPYDESLCDLVAGKTAELWENKWITDKSLKLALDPSKIVNRSALKSLKPIVRRAEFSLFSPYS
jgi:RNA-directed DNA polymerase